LETLPISAATDGMRIFRRIIGVAGMIIGICGGYQMLGRTVSDPLGIEGAEPVAEGLGLLDISTEMAPEKAVRNITARLGGR
jgi:adenosylcobyric acid synthase